MVPLPNFTTHDTKIEGKPKKGIIPFLRNTLFPPSYKDLEDKNFSPFLQTNKNEKAFVPAIEATINSRWYQAMTYWIKPLSLYAIFLILYTTIPFLFEKGNVILTEDTTKNMDFKENIIKIYFTAVIIGIGIFYYIGLYLLIIEFMQIRKYKIKYITILNLFDLCSIILGIIALSLSSFTAINMGIGYTIVTLILWIEMVSFITFEILIFNNLY